MMEDLKQQAERFGTEIRHGYVNKVIFKKQRGANHKIFVDDNRELSAKVIIIATGASAKYLGLESEARLKGGGVSACAVCDGFFYKGQDVAVVGAGDTATEETIYLSKICSHVHMFVRRNEMRASKTMQERVKNIKNVKIHYNTEIEEVLGDNTVGGVRVFNNISNKKQEIAITGLFIAIGHNPNTSVFREYIEMDNAGYILTKGKTTETNIPGVFACGDSQDPIYRQAVTAAGTGCMAALDAESYLASL
ncbi:thioredoxin reductase [Elysia marginata]|uniref:Thioredoxin reductase n=1 Tax=Elysia marginata TaxID=1093978 RepID=A0AAV4FMV8_9GAST|nr:thioredoxin reductase [Elysia marginata]